MDIENKKYDAFVSYRHAQLDQFVAEILHKQLEKFKIPRQIRKDKGQEKKSICIFRDQDELPLSSNLADPITEALKNSEFLIVICSPRLKESQWCKREIETFICLHGRDHIFTVLVEGEPVDSFPEQLLYEEIEEVDENGNIVIKNKTIEPLAADVRGSNFKEVKKKIKHEKLRILAPMFGLGYDDLKQRHKERVMKQAMAISAVITVAVFGFSTVSTFMALEIKKQSTQIADQNSTILEQNQEIAIKAAEIVQQSDQIKKQYEEAQMNYSKSLADASMRIMKQGDRLAAIYAARSGMPSNLANPEKPYTTECELALTDAMSIYRTGSTFVPNYVYQTAGVIQSMKVSNNGAYILISDSTYQVYVWETKTQKLLLQVQGKNAMAYNMINFFGDDKIIYNSQEGPCIQNFITQDIISMEPDVDTVIPYPDGKHYLTVSLNAFQCYNIEDSSLCFEIRDPSFWSLSADSVFISEDQKKIIIVNSFGSDPGVLILDAKDGDILFKQKLSCDLSSCGYQNGKLLVASFKEVGVNNYNGQLTCIDTKECNVLWKTVNNDSWLRGIQYVQNENNEYFYLYSSNKMRTYNANTGKLVAYSEYPQSMTNAYLFNNGQSEIILCDDGTLLMYDIRSGDVTDISYMIDYADYKISDFIWSPGSIYIQPKDRSEVIQYNMSECDKTEIAELSEDDIYCEINEDMSLSLNMYIDGTENYIGLKDIKSQDIKIKITDLGENQDIRYFFVGDGLEQFAVITDKCTIYSIKDGSVLRTIDLTDGAYRFDSWSSDGRLLFMTRNLECQISTAISTETGEIVMEVPANEQKNGIETIYSNDQSVFACYGNDNKELRLYHKGEESPYIIKQVSLADIRGIVFTDDGKNLCIIKSNGNSCFYDTETMDLVKIIYDVNIVFLKRIRYIETIHRYIMEVSGGAYLLDDSFNIVCSIPDYQGINTQEKNVRIKDSSKLYMIPYYSYDALIQKADKLLEGYKISDEIKRKYNVE